MKRILSVILTLLLLTSALIIPVNAQNEAYVYEGDTYYKFTFGENGTSYRGEYVDKKIYTHKNNQYYALYDNEGYNKVSLSENTIYDVNLGKNIDTMSIKAGGTAGNWRWVPLKADGTPFEVKPNASYTVNIKFYIKNLGTNDLNAYNWSPNATQRQELTDNYVKLLKVIRNYNPNAKIICLAGGMIASYKNPLQNAINSLGGNGANLYLYDITTPLNLGGAGHPTEYQQRIIANEVLEILQRDFLK